MLFKLPPKVIFALVWECIKSGITWIMVEAVREEETNDIYWYVNSKYVCHYPAGYEPPKESK